MYLLERTGGKRGRRPGKIGHLCGRLFWSISIWPAAVALMIYAKELQVHGIR